MFVSKWGLLQKARFFAHCWMEAKDRLDAEHLCTLKQLRAEPHNALRAAAEAVCGVAEATLPDAECQLDPSVLVMEHPELQGPVRELAGFAPELC